MDEWHVILALHYSISNSNSINDKGRKEYGKYAMWNYAKLR